MATGSELTSTRIPWLSITSLTASIALVLAAGSLVVPFGFMILVQQLQARFGLDFSTAAQAVWLIPKPLLIAHAYYAFMHGSTVNTVGIFLAAMVIAILLHAAVGYLIHSADDFGMAEETLAVFRAICNVAVGVIGASIASVSAHATWGIGLLAGSLFLAAAFTIYPPTNVPVSPIVRVMFALFIAYFAGLVLSANTLPSDGDRLPDAIVHASTGTVAGSLIAHSDGSWWIIDARTCSLRATRDVTVSMVEIRPSSPDAAGCKGTKFLNSVCNHSCLRSSDR